jgi:uncharacterized RDD family membrane protein YckC
MSAARGSEGAAATENVGPPALRLRAGLVTRVIAASVDGLVVAVLVGAAWAGWCAVAFVWHPRSFEPPSPPPSLAGLTYSFVAFAYLTAAWALSGRTIGYQLMGLRAVSSAGGPLRWSQSAGRAAMCVLLPIGLFWSAASPTRRALHDIVWRSYVRYDWTPHQAAVNAFAGYDADAGVAQPTGQPALDEHHAKPASLVGEPTAEGRFTPDGLTAAEPDGDPDARQSANGVAARSQTTEAPPG